jgi:erythromycin esterase-like protein
MVHQASALSLFVLRSVWRRHAGLWLRLTDSCERGVVNQLHQLQRHATDYASRDGRVVADELCRRIERAAGQRRRGGLSRDVPGRESSWNLRDRHMV